LAERTLLMVLKSIHTHVLNAGKTVKQEGKWTGLLRVQGGYMKTAWFLQTNTQTVEGKQAVREKNFKKQK